MSAVRMCDRCGTIFREGAEGATIATGTRNVRNERNMRMEQITITQDVCPPCSGTVEEVAPRLAIAATPPAAGLSIDGEAALQAAAARIPTARPAFDGVNDARD